MLRLLCPLCVISYYFMVPPSEDEPDRLTESEWIDRRKVVEMLRDEELTGSKIQRIGVIGRLPIHANETNTKIWNKNIPKAVEFFWWAKEKRSGASVSVKELLAKAEDMFGINFMMAGIDGQRKIYEKFFGEVFKTADEATREEFFGLAQGYIEKLEQLLKE